MKNTFLLIAIFLFFSCSPEAGDTPEEPPQVLETGNLAPSKPVLVSPEDELVCSQPNLLFKWGNSTDPEGGPIEYQLDISYIENFSHLLYSGNTASLTTKLELEKGQVFYWRVSAKDSEGISSGFSQVRTFFTEGEPSVNQLPSYPALKQPQNGAGINSTSVVLEWSAKDGDGDEINFDLYHGESNPPSLLKEGISTPNFTVSNLQKGKQYFWKIKVRDSIGGVAHGPIWSYKVNN